MQIMNHGTSWKCITQKSGSRSNYTFVLSHASCSQIGKIHLWWLGDTKKALATCFSWKVKKYSFSQFYVNVFRFPSMYLIVPFEKDAFIVKNLTEKCRFIFISHLFLRPPVLLIRVTEWFSLGNVGNYQNKWASICIEVILYIVYKI